MTITAEHRLVRAGHCLAMARELFADAVVGGLTPSDERIAALLDTTAARLSEGMKIDGEEDRRAYEAARLLQHAGRLLPDLRFDDWSLGETIAALVSAASAEMDAVARMLEREDLPLGVEG